MSETYTLLIDPATLRAHLSDPDWVVVDCRHQLTDHAYGPRVYAEGHVPGAAYADMEEDLSDPVGEGTGRHPLPDWQRFIGWVRRQGIRNTTQVVAYDDTTSVASARLWWLLRALGHERVAVLDGGYKRWLAEGGQTTTDVARPTPSDFTGTPDTTRIADLDEVVRVHGSPEITLVDARTPERYRGETEPIDPVAGHIPGAVNWLCNWNLGPEGTFLPAAELREKLHGVLDGRAPEKAIHYCGSGVAACHNLLAQAIAGMPEGRLYPGSWSQWCSDPARPVGKGDEGGGKTP